MLKPRLCHELVAVGGENEVDKVYYTITDPLEKTEGIGHSTNRVANWGKSFVSKYGLILLLLSILPLLASCLGARCCDIF